MEKRFDRQLTSILVGALGVGMLLVFAVYHVDGSAWAAAKVLAVCRGNTDVELRKECYEQVVPALYPHYDVPTLFSIVRHIQPLDPALTNCHVLAHEIAEVAVAPNREAWPTVFTQGPTDGLCSYGFVHGVFVAAFRDVALSEDALEAELPALRTLCASKEGEAGSFFKRISCQHALGHLYYSATNADIDTSMRFCDKTKPEGEESKIAMPLAQCYYGTVMLVFQELVEEDAQYPDPHKVTKETVTEFCGSLSEDRYVAACLRASWPLYETTILDGTGIEKFCAQTPAEPFKTLCFGKVFVVLAWKLTGETGRIAHACEQIQEKTRRSQCYLIVADDIMSSTGGGVRGLRKAIAMCRLATEDDVAAGCVDAFVRRSGRYSAQGSPERESYCAVYKSSDDRALCMSMPNE